MTLTNASSIPTPTAAATSSSCSQRRSSTGAACQCYRFNPYDAVQPKVFSPQKSIDDATSSHGSGSNIITSKDPARYLPSQSQHASQHQMQWHRNQLDGKAQYSAEKNSCHCPSSAAQEWEQEQTYHSQQSQQSQQPPQGTLHQQLTGFMNFCPYPTEAFENLEPTLPKHHMVRMFIGQLPYHVTAMQLGWLLYTFGAGANLYHFEQITKTDHSKGGIKVPTGCFHFHLEATEVAPMLEVLNNRLLVDDTGIWVTHTQQERHVLAEYCNGMKRDKTRRFQGRPYGTVVAQMATSTFNPDTFTPAPRFPGAAAAAFHRQY